MRHARTDYEAIQPWPTKRPHTVKVDGITTFNIEVESMSEMGGPRLEPIIPDDEPVFLIRAKDAVGPSVVKDWANRAELDGADEELVTKVRAWADVMEKYAKVNYGGGKTPDTPEGLLR